jgi:hypothetical protein
MKAEMKDIGSALTPSDQGRYCRSTQAGWQRAVYSRRRAKRCRRCAGDRCQGHDRSHRRGCYG